MWQKRIIRGCPEAGKALETRMRATAATFFLSASALLFAGDLMAGEYIYQWKDKSGQIVYSDNPPAGNIPSRRLRRDAVGEISGQEAPPAKSVADQEVESKKRQQEQGDKQAKADKETADAKARAQNCEMAKNQLAALESGQRMARFNAQGEREYLDDAQRAAEVERTKKAVADNCK
jgi:hypothetical protein